MSGYRKKTVRLKYLREKIKKCWYCKTSLVYYPLEKGESPPDNYATIEHLNSRHKYPNGRPKVWGKKRSLVVACYKCNFNRGREEDLGLPLEERQEKSGSKPLGEEYCQRCISPNPVWFAPNDIWNKVVEHQYNFLCPNCFADLAELKYQIIWELKPSSIKEAS